MYVSARPLSVGVTQGLTSRFQQNCAVVYQQKFSKKSPCLTRYGCHIGQCQFLCSEELLLLLIQKHHMTRKFFTEVGFSPYVCHMVIRLICVVCEPHFVHISFIRRLFILLLQLQADLEGSGQINKNLILVWCLQYFYFLYFLWLIQYNEVMLLSLHVLDIR